MSPFDASRRTWTRYEISIAMCWAYVPAAGPVSAFPATGCISVTDPLCILPARYRQMDRLHRKASQFDHVSFRTGDLAAVRTKLDALGIPFRGTPVPGFDLYQIILYDPAGVKVELTFDGGGAGNQVK